MLQLSFSIDQNGIYKPFVITHRSTYLCLHVSEMQRNAIGNVAVASLDTGIMDTIGYVAVASLERSIRDAIGYVAVASVTGLMRYRLEVKGGCERSATLRRTRASQS